MFDDKLQQLRKEYLDLMESCLTGVIFRDVARAPFGANTFDSHLREHGLDWPAHALTMIGSKRMANLRTLTETALAEDVPGDFMETGVWRGGACIMMRAILYAHGDADRRVWVADSFAGLPAPNDQEYPADAGSDFHVYEQLAISFEQVQQNFRSFGLLDDQTKFLKGWFKDTLPTAPAERLALLRLDGDMYESTMDALVSLYPKLSHRGYVIIDDYHVVPACKAAVKDYCNGIGIQPEVIEIDGVGVYWRKSDAAMQEGARLDKGSKVASPEMQMVRLKQALIDLNRNVIAVLSRSLTERDGTVVLLNQSLAERDAAVQAFERSLAERDSAMRGLSHSLMERDGAIEALNRSLAERDRTVEELNLSLAVQAAHAGELSDALIERRSAVEALDQTLTERNSEVDVLKQVIAGLYASSSWRITKPLRSIKTFFNGKQAPTGSAGRKAT